MYKPVITYTNATTGAVDYIGQSLPMFPFFEFNGTTDILFYLREAGTINITAVNATGGTKTFQYVVKDTKLGYPIAEGFGNYVDNAIVYVPRDRNYTIQIYPNESMPVSYHWNNFSSDSNYSFDYNSNYNATTHTLNKQFNVTENLIWVSGYALNTTGDAGYDEFTVIPFILEAGNMVYLGEDAAMPYNMSAWRRNETDGSPLNLSDQYTLSTGFYNITLPGPAESVNYLLFATAEGTDGKYYGGYRNISLNYSSEDTQINFTMYPLMSTGWASANSNITMNDAANWSQGVNISTARQRFNLKNSTSALSNFSAHVEVTVDYSDYNATEFTFMLDTPNTGAASFYIPLINETGIGIKEMNIYSQMYAPRRVGTRTSSEILSNNNITLSTFSPGDIEGQVSDSDIFIKFYFSNSTCDVPIPPDGCDIGAFGPSSEGFNQPREEFDPLSVVMGGGKLSFRMGYSGIMVHYVNVDMLASGPPDAMFDDNVIETSDNGFNAALRLGSLGPTIYDYVLISLPYTQGSSSVTGLNENSDVNISIPYFYEENSTGEIDWNNPIWDTSTNGTNGTLLAGNYSHYSEHSSEWETLMGNNTCITNQSALNATNPCYIDTTHNRIWLRIPHFSGAKPSIIGDVIIASVAEEETTDTEGGGGGYPTFSPTESELKQGYQKILRKNWKVSFKVNNESHIFKVENVTETNVKISISSEPQQATLQIGDERRFEITGDNYYDILVTLNDITDGNANITLKLISEEVTGETETEEQEKEAAAAGEGEKEKNLTWLWVLVGIIILAIIIGGGKALKKK